MIDFSSNYHSYDEPIPCPYCGLDCYAEFVDVGVGMVQCGPYRCNKCNAYEIGPEMEYEELIDNNGHYAGHGKLLNAEKFTEKEIEIGWYEPSSESKFTCIGCDKTPDEIDEYIESAKLYDLTPTQYLIEEEGTLHGFIKNKFYCTKCYIKAGMPLLPGRV